MGANPKAKGSSGERELLRWMEKTFDLDRLHRNHAQTAQGGADCLSIDGYAIEVKRQEILAIGAWWKQTTRQAVSTNRFPILAYRQNRKKWTFCLPASLVTYGSWGYISLTQEEFILWFKNRLMISEN